jgi:hypothetical protein
LQVTKGYRKPNDFALPKYTVANTRAALLLRVPSSNQIYVFLEREITTLDLAGLCYTPDKKVEVWGVHEDKNVRRIFARGIFLEKVYRVLLRRFFSACELNRGTFTC